MTWTRCGGRTGTAPAAACRTACRPRRDTAAAIATASGGVWAAATASLHAGNAFESLQSLRVLKPPSTRAQHALMGGERGAY